MEVYYPFMKECLKKFEYPNIHALMTDLDITDIFSTKNREFLVAWILKNMDDDYVDLLKNVTKEELAEIVYCNGFCGSSEKIAFMNGDLDSNTQMKILYKMFSMMNDLARYKDMDEEVKPFGNEELEDLIAFDTNLFPVYGPKQTLTSTERAKKMKEYSDEIERLKHLRLFKRPKDVEDAPLDSDLEKRIVEKMNTLEMNLDQFKRNALELLQLHRKDSTKINFQENLPELLETANKTAAVVSDTVENMNVIMNFKANTATAEAFKSKSSCSDQPKLMLGEISKLCDKISNKAETAKKN